MSRSTYNKVNYYYYYYRFTTLYRKTQVSRYQKDKPFWILLKQT